MAAAFRQALVTGGAGFIGSHLAEALAKAGLRVRVVDNLRSGNRENLAAIASEIEFIEGDLTDPGVCRAAVAGVDCVFHQAAIPSVPRSIADPLGSHSSGPTATLNLLVAAQASGVRRFLFAASSSAYGDTSELPKREDMLPRPLSPYAAGKLAGEHYVSVFAKTMGLDGASLRYFNVFGPRQDPSSPYSGVIALFLKAIAGGRRPVIHGDGRQTRDFTYVDNVVHANVLALNHPRPLAGAIYNVGAGASVSLLGLVEGLNRLLGKSLEPEFLPARAGDVRDSLASLDLIRDELGYTPIVSFDEGLKRLVGFETSPSDSVKSLERDSEKKSAGA